MNVLLVDDEAGMLKLMKTMLQSGGHQVFEARSGHEALTLADEHDVDILIADVVLEDIDGPALAHSLVEQRPHLPVLFVSGQFLDTGDERPWRFRSAFLPKPFLRNDLLNAVGELAAPIAFPTRAVSE